MLCPALDRHEVFELRPTEVDDGIACFSKSYLN
jgi:hypothetical protein